MSADWPVLTLGDVCEKITDGAHNSPKSVDRGKPMASVKDLTRFGVDLSEARLIAEEEFDKLVKQGCQPEVGDVLIAKDGNSALDTVCTVNEPLDAVMLSSVAILRPDKAKLDSDFLKYYFCSRQVIDYLKGNFISGAAIPRVVLKDFRKAEIKVPPLEIQKEIAKKLRMLDDKIELNRQTNQTLEHIAQAIFKSWFVDFDPVKAKIAAIEEGQDPQRAAMAVIAGKSIEQLDTLPAETIKQLQTTADLFPDALVDSELGEIPEGWKVVRFKQIVSKYIDNRGKTPPTTDKGIPLLEVKHLPDGAIKPDVNTDKYVTDDTFNNWFRAHLESDDIIISTVGTIGRICMVPEEEKIAIAQNLLGMRFNSEKVSPYFMYYQMNGYRFRHDVDARLVITVQASIKRKDLETIDLLSPPINLQSKFQEFAKPFVKQQQSDEATKLAKLRDLLLPKLLSGELE